MKYEVFKERFGECSFNDKVAMYNEYSRENGYEEFFIFDEEFFNVFFSSPLEAVRACHFGNIENWNDEYLRFNGYGNIESFSAWRAAEEAECYVDEIYEHPEIWCEYIDDDEEEEED